MSKENLNKSDDIPPILEDSERNTLKINNDTDFDNINLLQNITTNNIGHIEQPKREENPFSFKHFLKRDSSLGSNTSNSNITHQISINKIKTTAVITMDDCIKVPSAVITAVAQSPTTVTPTSSLSSMPLLSTNCSTTKNNNVSSYHNHSITGARPKVPQQQLLLLQQQQISNQQETSKMKRSPRFPSFDSQASLYEYAYDNLKSALGGQPFVQRSYSNYDIDNGVHINVNKNDRKKLHSSHSSTNCARNSSTISSGHRVQNTEFSAALPDFVQDHLVMEQWYSNSSIGSNSAINNVSGISNTPNSSPLSSVNFDHLPDFTVNNIESEFSNRRANLARTQSEVINNNSNNNDMPFDLTFNSTTRCRTPIIRNSPTIPLDLPNNNQQQGADDGPLDLPINNRGANNIDIINRNSPNDLHLDLTDRNNSRNVYCFQNMDGPNQANDKIQTLPDFLSDGPIHSSSGRLADVAQDLPVLDSPENNISNNNSIITRLRLENERLRHELDNNRQALSEQVRCTNELERQIEIFRQNEQQYNITLSQSMEQVEENLERSNKRAAAAQTLVNKLKQQVKQLTNDVENIRRENESLKEEGAVGGGDGGVAGGGKGSDDRTFNRPSRTLQLSRELMLAATTAENNLRQLLTGVDNLRIIATTIENIDRIVDPIQNEYLSECDEDDFTTGPAL